MARSIWTGSIGFGLVSIPVRLVTAVRSHTLHFNMICGEDGQRVRQQLVCGEGGHPVSRKDTQRGFQVAPDEYVVVEDEEIQALAPKKSREIEIVQFVDLADIDPVYFDKPYYLVPAQQGAKAYRLLLEVMREAGKVGIGRFVLRNKEHLVALRPMERALCLETMRFADEVVGARELGDDLPGEDVPVDERQKKVALQLVETLSEPFEPERFADEYHQQLMELIERKAQGERIVAAPREEAPRGQVLNLMDALQASLDENRRAREAGDGDKRGKRRKKAG